MAMRALLSLALMLPCVLLSACDRGHRCEERSVEYPDLAKTTPAGLSGHDFAKLAVGSYPITLSTPHTSQEDNFVTLTPAISNHTRATLVVEVMPQGVFSHIVSTYVPCKSWAACTDNVVVCQSRLSLPVRARLSTADGRINETWEGELMGNDPSKDLVGNAKPGTAKLEVVSFALRRAPDSFGPSLSFSAPRLDPGVKLGQHDIVLSASFGEAGLMSGALRSDFEAQGGKGKEGWQMQSRQELLTFQPIAAR